jgi:5-methylcytosine-specific restriction endonuclease McrA
MEENPVGRKPVTYPWDHDLVDGEYQCVYCGRLMDDIKAIRRVQEGGQTLHACMLCAAVLNIAKPETLTGRQNHIRNTLVIRTTDEANAAVYVDRYGRQVVRKRKAYR